MWWTVLISASAGTSTASDLYGPLPETPATVAPEDAEYYRRERYDGEFHRVIALPDDVDPDRVGAKYRDGVLQVTVQRRATVRPRQIEVN